MLEHSKHLTIRGSRKINLMLNTKYCCGGQNAKFIVPARSVSRKGVMFKCAVYQCIICKEYSIRGETDQHKEWNTLAKIITAEEALKIQEEYKEYRQRKFTDVCP